MPDNIQKAIVTFANPDNDKKIEIKFEYNKETSDLDYNIDMNYDGKESMDFVGFLANMFLNTLKND